MNNMFVQAFVHLYSNYILNFHPNTFGQSTHYCSMYKHLTPFRWVDKIARGDSNLPDHRI